MNWTKEQQQVIDLRHQNMLVSAAAGSGKTAVLVERILSLVTDPEHPVDIDRLLVVTFTRAAAGEMKDRIGRALEKRLAEDPENVHLQKQGVLLHYAQINTIDGFCAFVLQNYFHRIDLDPGYRIAEEDDLKLLQGKVLDDLLEEEYAEGSEAFRHFAEAYGRGKNDKKITEMITQLYTFAVSDPDPDLWLEHCLEAYGPRTEEELEQAGWMQSLAAESGRRLNGLLQSAVQLRDFVLARPEAPQAYLPALQSDVAALAELAGETSFRVLQERFAGLTFTTLGRKKEPDVDPKVRELVKAQRDAIKKQVSKIRDTYFRMSGEQILEDLAVMRPQAEELVRLVRRFAEAYTTAKRAKNMIDFSDLEHLALQILTERDETGVRHPTSAAEELSERFEEVMIDEYQDSNFLQERILAAVSKNGAGAGGRFMVGDIKQSIYGFRQARPELFLEKMHAYTSAEGETPASGVRIDLHQNFRSRPQVLETANALFSRLMIPELGGILYDDAAALHPAASYPDTPDPAFPDTELLLIDKKAPEFDEDRSRAAMVEAEAHAAAAKIRECMRSGKLWDAGKEEFRPVQYRDCVILMRAAGTWGDTFVRVLQAEGIPAYAASGKGYFTTVEITTILSYLRVCDNPLQDIPLAAVLHSPIGGMTEEEMARLRIGTPKGTLMEALRNAASEKQGTTGKKAAHFLEQLESFRERVPRTPVHVLIRQILDETGYGDFAAAMPAGAQRRANLNMLVERAAAYEKNDYHGLFRFIRYIEQLTEREVDFGEVSLYGEEEDIVRVMTIHKSKGLEFPIVILAGIGSRFNTTDEKSPVVLHAKLGIGLSAVYTEQHVIHSKPLLRAAVQNAVRHDMLAEELRVLYVAVTRAREKLILIGTEGTGGKEVLIDGDPTYQQLIHAGSFLDWINMARAGGAPLKRTLLDGKDLISEEIGGTVETETGLQELRRLLREGKNGSYAPDMQKELAEIGSFRYREERNGLPAKLTVSEWKRMQSRMTAEEEQGEALYPEEVITPYVPKFVQAAAGEAAGQEKTAGPAEKAESAEERPDVKIPSEILTGAARGTAYHHVLAVLEYGKLFRKYDRMNSVGQEQAEPAYSGQQAEIMAEKRDIMQETPEENFTERVQRQIDGMLENGLLSVPEYQAVRAEDIAAFVNSPLGRRMAAADAAGTLRREQPFVLDIPADRIRQMQKTSADSEEHPEDDTILLLQGTIDAYWEEDGAYILLDYKTDRVRPGEEPTLADRYGIQLACYRMALEQITEIPVRETYIYAVATGRSVRV